MRVEIGSATLYLGDCVDIIDTLLTWAGNARRRAMAEREPAQASLF